jgi:methionyl-tRNA formyltransferase
MNIIFMGTPEFAVPSLKILLKTHHNISAVVTVPDKPQGRGLKVAHSAVKKFALENNLNILQPEKLRDESFINDVKSLNPDLIIVVAFKILPKEVYSIPQFGSINLHASLLPQYRGAAPINWALINGDKETGVTTFFLQDKVDTGSIIMQNYCDINEDDDAGSLHDKLAELGALTIYSTVNLIEGTKGKPPLQNQNDSEATKAPKIFKKDCLIDWNNNAEDVYNFIRGLSPYPAAYTELKGKSIKILKSAKTQTESNSPAGKFSADGENLFTACSDNLLEIVELQPEGKKRMSAKEFLNGNRGLLE